VSANHAIGSWFEQIGTCIGNAVTFSLDRLLHLFESDRKKTCRIV
jgi:hypothetical protein